MNYIKSLLKSGSISSIVLLIMGLLLAVFPNFFVSTICYVLGALAIAYAVIRFMNYMSTPMAYFGIGTSLIAFFLGLFLISNSAMLVAFIPTIVGICLLIDGISKIKKALEYKAMNVQSWWAVLVTAIITLVFAAVLLLFPHRIGTLALRILGIALIVQAITNFFNISYAKRLVDKTTPIEGTFSDDDKNN